VNTSDLSGERAGKGLSAWASELSQRETVAYETALREEAERKAREAAEAARAYAAMTGGSPEGESYEEEGPEEEYWEEEGGEEYAAYHPNREAERDASFGPAPVMVEVSADESQAGEMGEGDGGERQSGPAPELKCGGGLGGESEFAVSSGEGRREYVANQCLAQKSYPRGRRWHVQSIGAHPVRGRGQIRYEHGSEGCLVGAVGGAVFAGFSTVGLEAPTGAIAGCAIGVGVVELFEDV
jgi:hypothetical protein